MMAENAILSVCAGESQSGNSIGSALMFQISVNLSAFIGFDGHPRLENP